MKQVKPPKCQIYAFKGLCASQATHIKIQRLHKVAVILISRLRLQSKQSQNLMRPDGGLMLLIVMHFYAFKRGPRLIYLVIEIKVQHVNSNACVGYAAITFRKLVISSCLDQWSNSFLQGSQPLFYLQSSFFLIFSKEKLFFTGYPQKYITCQFLACLGQQCKEKTLKTYLFFNDHSFLPIFFKRVTKIIILCKLSLSRIRFQKHDPLGLPVLPRSPAGICRKQLQV